MLHMAKGKFFFSIIPVFLGVIYVLYVFYDHYQFDDHGVTGIIETRNSGLEKYNKEIEGLIIGGSNSMWGISANNLSKATNKNFYNLSMHSNGVNYKNYFSYLKETIPPLKAKKIKYIIWSTIHAIHEPPWNDFDRDILGRLRISKMIPNQSILSFLYKKSINQESIFFQVDEEFGDFIFDDFKCTLSDSRYLDPSAIQTAYSGSYNLVDLKVLKKQLDIYKSFFQSYFSNAEIFFVVPSTLHEISYDESKINEFENMIEALDMKLHFQESIQDINYFCESDHHPNEKGRELRTDDIINLLNLRQ